MGERPVRVHKRSVRHPRCQAAPVRGIRALAGRVIGSDRQGGAGTETLASRRTRFRDALMVRGVQIT